jgi:hypothetical protein
MKAGSKRFAEDQLRQSIEEYIAKQKTRFKKKGEYERFEKIMHQFLDDLFLCEQYHEDISRESLTKLVSVVFEENNATYKKVDRDRIHKFVGSFA